jgi:hypothetical protein
VIRANLLKECSYLEEYSTYHAEAHYQAATMQRYIGLAAQIGPPVATAILGALTATGYLPLFGAWLTVLSAVFTALSTGLSPFARLQTHLHAAKKWTVLKQDAKRLRDTFSLGLTDEALATSVGALADRFNELVLESPPTADKVLQKAKATIRGELNGHDSPARKPDL